MCKLFFAFSLFFCLWQKNVLKHWIRRFWPANVRQSTCSLVEIHNRPFLLRLVLLLFLKYCFPPTILVQQSWNLLKKGLVRWTIEAQKIQYFYYRFIQNGIHESNVKDIKYLIKKILSLDLSILNPRFVLRLLSYCSVSQLFRIWPVYTLVITTLWCWYR